MKYFLIFIFQGRHTANGTVLTIYAWEIPKISHPLNYSYTGTMPDISPYNKRTIKF